MIRKIVSVLSILCFISLPLCSFAGKDDTPCAAGDGNPLCNSDMLLYAKSNKGLFCNQTSDNLAHSFRHAAVEGSNIIGKPQNWNGIKDRLKSSVTNFACHVLQHTWCVNHWGHKGGKYSKDCETLLNNCINDYNYAINVCHFK